MVKKKKQEKKRKHRSSTTLTDCKARINEDVNQQAQEDDNHDFF